MEYRKYIIISILTILILVSPLSIKALTKTELLQQITEITQLIQQLQQQLNVLTGQTISSPPMSSSISGIPSSYSFNTNLKQGLSNNEVKYLQILLNQDSDTRVSLTSYGSLNNETTYFGNKTKQAIIKFQEKYRSETLSQWGLSKGTGYVGSSTRKKLNQLLSQYRTGTAPTTGGTTASQATGYCGDNIIQTPNSQGTHEVCDNTNLNNNTCKKIGYAGGTLTCSNACLTFDTSKCQRTATGGGSTGDGSTGNTESDPTPDLDPTPINNPPVLSTIGNKTIDENSTLTFTILGSDSESSTLYYSTQNFPTGATFSNVTRTFAWTPDYSQSGNYNVTFIVSDQEDTDQETITITVNNVAQACVESWSCTTYSTCSNSSQTRTCTDVNSCGTTISKPSEIQSCIVTPITGDIWHVRPLGGDYDLEDGSSYENAWNGLMNVVWGPGGIEAGDTLYISGTHINTFDDYGYVNSYQFTPKASGTSENYITIKGHPDHPAIIWNAYIDDRTGGINPDGWTELDTPGVYYQETSPNRRIYGPPIENISDASSDRYTELASAEAVIASGETGVYYKEEFPDWHTKIWLRPHNPATFTTNLYGSGFGGYSLVIGGSNNYIVFEDIVIFGRINEVIGGEYHHYIFKNCKFDFMRSVYGYQPHNAHNITFDGCEFTNSGNGIYGIQGRNLGYFYILNSYFHDGGTTSNPSHPDNHAIGWQNYEYLYIQNNTFERWDSAIDIHIGASPIQKHIYVTGNRIDDMNITGKANSGSGIIFEGAGASPAANQGDYIIANNIITNCGLYGIRTDRKGDTKIYNNVVYNCAPNYSIEGFSEEGPEIDFYNNISHSPKAGSFHVYVNLNDPLITWDMDIDNNIYYPNADQSGAFFIRLTGPGEVIGSSVATFDEWKEAWSAKGGIVDRNSFIEDPLFISELSNNFHLKGNSPAIDTGIDIGLTLDHEGNIIPQGLAPDIGAYESPYTGISSEPIPECASGQTESCSSGLQGICSTGTKTCTDETWGSCIQNNQPTTEICNDFLDNDCDGTTDCSDSSCSTYPACVVDPPSGDIPSDYVSYWKFDGNANDEKGINNGTIVGSPNFISGVEGQALSLDGNNQWVDISDDNLPAPGTNDFTIVAWVKAEQTGTQLDIITKGGHGAGDLQFYKVSSDKLYFIADGFGIAAGSPTSNSWPNDIWFQAAVTKQGSLVTVYQDAVSVGTDTGSIDINTEDDWRIGANSSGVFDFIGDISSVLIYDRALSAEEIQAIYNAQKPEVIAEAEIEETKLSWLASILDSIKDAIEKLKDLF